MIPSAGDRQPIALRLHDDDLADLLALVRAWRDEDTLDAGYSLFAGGSRILPGKPYARLIRRRSSFRRAVSG